MSRDTSFFMDASSFTPKREFTSSRLPTMFNRDMHTDLELSLSLAPSEMQRMFSKSRLSNLSLNTSRLFQDSVNDFEEPKNLQTELSAKEKTDMLFTQFLLILHSRTNEMEIFDTIQDIIQTCSETLDEIAKGSYRDSTKYNLENYKWLQEERNAWRLLFALYKDRSTARRDDDMDCDDPPLGGSEKVVVNHLYSVNANLREYQLVVDWLEMCAKDRQFVQSTQFSDRTNGWENTLFQLKNPHSMPFGGGRDVVQNLDPDAPIREGKPLHPLDMEDESRLSKHMFNQIRQGGIEEAKALCEYFGQPWRAAILEGWRLSDDPNNDMSNATEKLPIEGNPRRDLWKLFAWKMADSSKFDEYSRAIAGALCGHLNSLVAVSNNSWEDLLWVYLKVQIDIRVESELRSCCMRNYIPMPDSYWNNKMAIEQVFEELSVHKHAPVRLAAESIICVIYKFLILDNVSDLLDYILSWMDDHKLTPHMLRFLAHIVLFMRQIGKVEREDVADGIIKAYVESLIEFKDPQLISFYTAALPRELQIVLYSKFLEEVTEKSARGSALEEAMATGLDVDAITSHTVEAIRNRAQLEVDQKLYGDISKEDEEKISALEWLTFYPQHRGELLWQTNAMIRNFLADEKFECVRKAFKMVPKDTIEHIINIYGSKDNLPCKEECSLKEFLCHQTYMTALDGFNEWNELLHKEPKKPDPVDPSANFTERIAYDHKEQTYEAELERWKMTVNEQANVTKDLLLNVLRFPDKGWLIDPDTVKEPNDIEQVVWQNRLQQLNGIRRLCIPEVVLLLHQILHVSGEYKECVKLSDEIASEQRQHYKVYSKHKLAEILSKITESSLALMNQKLDPWGYHPSM